MPSPSRVTVTTDEEGNTEFRAGVYLTDRVYSDVIVDSAALIGLFGWDEAQFRQRLQGSPIYRIGHTCWLRNIAVALGNAPTTPEVIAALDRRRDDPSELVREHVHWALGQHGG